MTKRNIIQYKPKGPANIFAPTIRINGNQHSYEEHSQPPIPSNLDSSDFVNYPENSFLNSSRRNNYQTNLTNSHFDNLHTRIFDNLFSNTEEIDRVTASNNVDLDFNTLSDLFNQLNELGLENEEILGGPSTSGSSSTSSRLGESSTLSSSSRLGESSTLSSSSRLGESESSILGESESSRLGESESSILGE